MGGKKFDVPLSMTAKRKHPKEWTVLGTPVPRLDLPALVSGEMEFVHNVRVPGMLHGQVVRPPSYGAHAIPGRTRRGSARSASPAGSSIQPDRWSGSHW